MSGQRYTLPAIVLHWAQAIVVVWLLWLGWTMVPLVLLLSSVVGAVIGLGYLAIRKESAPFAFGPYIAIAGFVALLWGQPLLSWYLG